MQITFKLYATLSSYLPQSADKHAVTLDIPEDITTEQIIDQFKVPKEMAYLVLLNGVYLRPDERKTRTFKDGDVLAIWPPVAGG